MTKPKRHHYLPQFYLEGFAEEGRIWIFDRATGKVRRDTPVNTAVIGHYYSAEDAKGETRTEVETFLSQLEGAAKPIIQKLDLGENITFAEKEQLAAFVGFLFGRVPQFERTIEQMNDHLMRMVLEMSFGTPEAAQRSLDEVRARTGEEPRATAEQMVDFTRRGEYTTSVHRNASLRAMMDLGQTVTNIIARMNWFVAHVPDAEDFITTDAPFTVFSPMDHDPGSFFSGVGIGTPGAFKCVPLTRRTTLAIGDAGPAVAVHVSIPVATIKPQNLAVASDCDRFVIGPTEKLVREIAEGAELIGTKPGPRMRISR